MRVLELFTLEANNFEVKILKSRLEQGVWDLLLLFPLKGVAVL